MLTFALTTRHHSIFENSVCFSFNEMNAAVFELLVPSAERNDDIAKPSSGHWYQMPSHFAAGQALPSIANRALPGYLDFNPYANYVYLEGDEGQLADVIDICKQGRLSGDNVFFCKDGFWWTCNRASSTNGVMKLAENHELYCLNPPTGWQATHPAKDVIGGDVTYWLAVNGNYGTEAKRGANRMVRTLKISPAAFHIINKLFHEQFDDYSSSRSTYHYIDFHNDGTLARKDNNFLYFQVEGRLLKGLEAVTRKLTSPRAYVWIDDQWYLMPSAQGTYLGRIGGEYPYRPAATYETPLFRPTGSGSLLPGNKNERVLRGNGITASYAEERPGIPGWWWIKGDREEDTKSIRTQLRAYGCDWSRKRSAWFLKDTRELPDGLKRLLGIFSSPTPTPTAPAPVQTPATALPTLDFRWKQGETVYAACDIERPDLRIIKYGTQGTITGYEGDGDRFKYIVWFDNHSQFAVKDDLLTDSAPLPGIQITRHALHLDEHGITGFQARADPPATPANNPFRRENTPAAPASASRSVFGDSASKNTGANAFANALRDARHATSTPAVTPAPQPALSVPADSLAAPISKIIDMSAHPAAAPQAAPAPTQRRVDPKTGRVLRLPGTEETPSPLVITSAEQLIGSRRNPDRLKQAIERAQSLKEPLEGELIAPGHIVPIPMEYVGELTGSVSADIHCYGYAVDNGICVYLNMGGSRTGIEAIRAKMSSAGVVNMTPWDGPAVELTAGEKQTGMYVDFFSNMSERRFYHLILLHRSITHPIYAEQFTTYVLGINPLQAAMKIYSHIQQLVNIPVFPGWRDYLWRAGHLAHLIRPTQNAGGLNVLALTLDRDEWTSLIAGGIEKGLLTLPIA